jgi:hypothetical protein
MTYKILSTRQNEETLYTEVEYNLDGVLTTIEVSHFAPTGLEIIEQNIINRGLTEIRKLEIARQIQSLIPQIEINVETEL